MVALRASKWGCAAVAVVVLALGASWAGATTLTPGDILISNHGGSNVQRLDPTTGTVTTLTSVTGTPIGLAFDASNNLYINVGDGMQKFVTATDTLTPFFTGVGQREGLTFDPTTGHFFSVSFGNNAIEEVDAGGGLVRTITIPGSTQLLGVSARGGKLVVTDYGAGKVYIGTTTGSSFDLVGSLTPFNTYAPDIDAAGNIYANDFATGKCVKFTLSGGVYTPSDFITGLNTPANGLSIGDDGSLTISEFGAGAISVWNSDGTLRQRYFGISDPDELVVFAPVRQGGGEGPGPGVVPEPMTLLGLFLAVGSAGRYTLRRVRR